MRLRRLLKVSVLGALATGLAGAFVLGGWVLVPLPAGLLDAPSTGLRIEDRHGIVLRSTRAADGSRARWTPLGEMDPDLLLAFTAVEDKRFWSHGGIDLLAVGRSALANQRAGRVVSGASTIPMQLVRLLSPSPRGWRGKLRESAWALRLDWHLQKEVLLEQYLNRVHLGQGAVGVTAASALYFGASAGEVSVGEAAMLAGLAHAPSRDNPMADPYAAKRRRRVALARMRRAAMIAPGEEKLADAEPLLPPRPGAPFLAPHFTTRLVQLDERLARTGGSRDRTWRATLDAALQAELEAEVRHAVDVLRARNVRHAAVVVLDNASGDVLAWVGSPDFWESRTGQTDMVVSPRQPGSALKPFLYALAFDRGITAATVLADVPRSYATATGAYTPRNYDRRFRGPVRAREALASSYNVPAVELAERVGVGALHATLRRAGFASLGREADHYGLGLALGNGDVTLIELANGYRALANGGDWSPWRWLESGPMGSSAFADPGARGDPRVVSRVVSREAAALVLDVLADPSARAPGFGLQTPFDFPFRVAVKTGTSRHFTDNWAVGTTQRFTVAVWVGNFSGQPMQGVSGVSGAGPLLNRVVNVTAQRYAPGELAGPASAGLTPTAICRVSGLLATPSCPGLQEWFIAGTAPTQRDDWVGGGRVRLPAEYAEWSASAPRGYVLGDDEAMWEAVPAEDRLDSLEAQRARAEPVGFRVVSPADGDVLRVPPGVPPRYATIALKAVGAEGDVQWFVNGRAFQGSRWPLEVGEYVIQAVGADGVRAEARVTVK